MSCGQPASAQCPRSPRPRSRSCFPPAASASPPSACFSAVSLASLPSVSHSWLFTCSRLAIFRHCTFLCCSSCLVHPVVRLCVSVNPFLAYVALFFGCFIFAFPLLVFLEILSCTSRVKYVTGVSPVRVFHSDPQPQAVHKFVSCQVLSACQYSEKLFLQCVCIFKHLNFDIGCYKLCRFAGSHGVYILHWKGNFLCDLHFGCLAEVSSIYSSQSSPACSSLKHDL